MLKRRLITQSRTKRATAAAISEAQARNDWSNSDAADALGCSEGTIRNRLNRDDPKHQMSVHELLRSIQWDGPALANRILGEVGHEAIPTGCTSAPDALAVASAQARCAAQLIEAGADGVDRTEARALLPVVTALRADLAGLEAALRTIITGEPPAG